MPTSKRAKDRFTRFDSADYLKSEADMAAYLVACMEEADDDPALVAVALGGLMLNCGSSAIAKAVESAEEIGRQIFNRNHGRKSANAAPEIRLSISPKCWSRVSTA